MILVLVPPGRGRWSPIRVSYDPRRRQLPNLVEVKVNDRIPIGGIAYRVARVEP